MRFFQIHLLDQRAWLGSVTNWPPGTLVIRREYLHFVPKYSRYEKRHKNLAAHVSPAFRVEPGDKVVVGQCRPLSKTVRFNVLRVLPRTGKAVKSFSKF